MTTNSCQVCGKAATSSIVTPKGSKIILCGKCRKSGRR